MRNVIILSAPQDLFWCLFFHTDTQPADSNPNLGNNVTPFDILTILMIHAPTIKCLETHKVLGPKSFLLDGNDRIQSTLSILITASKKIGIRIILV